MNASKNAIIKLQWSDEQKLGGGEVDQVGVVFCSPEALVFVNYHYLT